MKRSRTYTPRGGFNYNFKSNERNTHFWKIIPLTFFLHFSIFRVEHFATPLFLAQKHNFYAKASPPVEVEFKPYPSGTGHMIQSLKSSEIDVAIGLTEGWIAGIKGSAQADWYKVVGKYVETPLCMYTPKEIFSCFLLLLAIGVGFDTSYGGLSFSLSPLRLFLWREKKRERKKEEEEK